MFHEELGCNAGGYVDAHGHTEHQSRGSAKSSHRDTRKTASVELLLFHSFTPKTLHIKPVCLGLSFS